MGGSGKTKQRYCPPTGYNTPEKTKEEMKKQAETQDFY
jgi:hypothetical protein